MLGLPWGQNFRSGPLPYIGKYRIMAPFLLDEKVDLGFGKIIVA